MKRTLLLAVAAATALPVFGQTDPDRKKNATALFYEGLRFETQPPIDLSRAIDKYTKAVKKAGENKKIACRALVHIGRCNEKLEPENVDAALAAYERAASEFGDVEKFGALAQEKAALKGVDVYLELLYKKLEPWRVSDARDPKDETLEQAKDEAWGKINAKGSEAVPGLLWGLGHRDPVVRDFAADKLVEVVDAGGVSAVIAKLTDGDPRVAAGASTALQKIYKIWNQARAHDLRAEQLSQEITYKLDPNSKAAGHHAKLEEEARNAETKASEIRKGIPKDINTPEVQTSLERIIGDESASVAARQEAARAASWIGRISGTLVDAILAGTKSPNRNVREACCRAAGAVDTTISADKHKLAGRLIEAIQYEPAKDPVKADADWANDESVRQAAAEALENIALVKSLPALIEALDDNDSRVRGAAFRSLNRITGLDLDFGTDDQGNKKTYAADAPLAERREAQKKWQEWWGQTSGVVVLVERFWAFQSRWSKFDAVKLFNPKFFLKVIESRAWATTDAQAAMERAKRVTDEFQRHKDVFIQDAVDLHRDLGDKVFDQLLTFIGGETAKDQGNASGATSQFVAEACARIIEANNAAAGASKLVEAVGSGDTPAKQAGACAAIGFLPKASIGSSERDALQSRGLAGATPLVQEQAAYALAKVGDDGAAADLTQAAESGEQAVQLAVLTALREIHPNNDETIEALGKLAADERDDGTVGERSPDFSVREYAVDALGAIANPSAVDPYLIRARRDTTENVRRAASRAIKNVYQSAGAETSKSALAILGVEGDAGAYRTNVDEAEKRKTYDRIGASLAIGDMEDGNLAKGLARRLRDENAPRELRDGDPGVRMAMCKALGNMKNNARDKFVVGRLYRSMWDENEREPVRQAAYEALKAIMDVDPDKEGSSDTDKMFKASDPKPKRDEAIGNWKTFLDGAQLLDPDAP